MTISKVYCIIVTYNAMKWVDRCLMSLRESSINVTPVIVDNKSSDETVDYIKATYPDAIVFANAENKGFGQANNQGIAYAYHQGATHVFLLNQDAWVSKNGVEMMVQIMDDNDLAVLSPTHLNGQGQQYDYSFLEAVLFEEHDHRYINDLYFGCLADFYPIEKVNAAAWMISRTTIETIGGFDPLFFHYGEDINYCQRLRYHNKQMAFTPKATICHDRKQHGNMEVFNKRAIITILFTCHSNINHSFFSRKEKLLRFTLLLYFNILKSLLSFNLKRFFFLSKNYTNYIVKIPQIINSRRINKTVGSNWLNL